MERGLIHSARLVLLIYSVALVMSGVAFSQEVPLSLSKQSTWKPGDGWPVQVKTFAPSGKERSYQMHIVVTAVQKHGPDDCWRLELIPIAAPADVGTGYRILIDRKTGSLRVTYLRKGGAEAKIPLVAGLPISPEPPPGFPFEFLALLEPGTFTSPDGKTSLRVSKRRENDFTLWDAILSVEGKEKLVVKQKWLDGEKWWREYERYVDGRKELHAMIPHAQLAHIKRQEDIYKGVVIPKEQKTKLAEHQLTIRRDPRLQVKVSIAEVDPDVHDLLDRLRQATGISLILDENLTYHDPKFGDVQARNTSAWVVMNIIAERDMENGKWEKTADGYMLTGTSKALKVPPRRSYWGWLGGGAGLLLFASAGFGIFRWRRKRSPTPPPAPAAKTPSKKASAQRPSGGKHATPS